MKAFSRREFGSLLVAGMPLARSIRLRASGMVVGVTSSSFRELPRVTGRGNVDAVMHALGALSVSRIELAFSHIEPAPPSTAPFLGGSAAYPRRIVLTPEEINATNATARTALRTWRREAAPGVFEDVRRTLTAAGITVHGAALSYDASFTDDEIDATFRHARALGVGTIGSPLTIEMAQRLVSFAERHQVTVAIHNQVDGNEAGHLDTPRLEQALALSPRFGLKLDVGNLTASNRDAVAELRKHRSRISYVILRDRLRNRGASQPFGEGDTPLRGVLDVLRASPSIPAFVEYDYVGLRPAGDEIKASLEYLNRLSS